MNKCISFFESIIQYSCINICYYSSISLENIDGLLFSFLYSIGVVQSIWNEDSGFSVSLIGKSSNMDRISLFLSFRHVCCWLLKENQKPKSEMTETGSTCWKWATLYTFLLMLGLRQRLCWSFSSDFLALDSFSRESGLPSLPHYTLVALESFIGQVQGFLSEESQFMIVSPSLWKHQQLAAVPSTKTTPKERKRRYTTLVKWLVNFHPERWWTVTTRPDAK